MAKSSSEPKITRITATDAANKTKKSVSAPLAGGGDTKPTNGKKKRQGNRVWRYLKGSWSELRLVRWPDRKSTWKMTGALVVFTVTFGVIILLLDYLFQFVFKLLINK